MQIGWMLGLVLVIGAVSVSNATVFRSGDRIAIPAGTTIDDEVYAFGQSIVVSGSVSSDLTAAGDEIRLAEQGSIGGSANIAGSTVNVEGTVASNLRAAGNQVTVSSAVGRNAALAGNQVMLAGAGRVTRDLFVAGSSIDIEGSVGRNVRIMGEAVTVNGPVAGNVNIDANRVTIGPDAVIRGNLTYTSAQRATIDPGAQILGRTIQRAPTERRDAFTPFRWFLWAVGFVSLFLVGLLILAVAPATMTDAANMVFSNTWLALLLGFILLIVVPTLVLVLMFTLIGIPLSLIILAMYLILLYISRIVIALAIGRWLLTRGGRPEPSRYLAFFSGLLIYWIVTAIPIVGPFLSFVGLILSLGALMFSRYNFIRQMRAENRF